MDLLMNIFFFNSIGHRVWGGGEKWMLVAALGLRARGHIVYMGGREGSLFLQKCQRHGFLTSGFKIEGDFGPVNILKLRRFFHRNRIQCVIANFNKVVRLSACAAKFMEYPVLIIARNGLPIINNTFRYKYSYRFFADKVLTNTYAIKNRYLGYGWMGNDFIKVIHNGIDVRRGFEHPPSGDRLTAKSENHPTVSIIGRLVPQKGHRYFIESAKAIHTKFPHVQFLIVGGGYLEAELKSYVCQLGIDQNVHFLGHHDNVLSVLSKTDIMALPSEEEGLPNAVMEAMLLGKPVVATDVGGVSELVVHGKTGYIVDKGNVEQLTERIIHLLNHPERCREFGKEGRTRILNHFTLDKMLNQLEMFLEVEYERKRMTYRRRWALPLRSH